MTPDKTVIQQGVRNHIWEILVWSGEKKSSNFVYIQVIQCRTPFILTNFSTDNHKILPLAFERYQKEIVKKIVKLCLHSRILTAHKKIHSPQLSILFCRKKRVQSRLRFFKPLCLQNQLLSRVFFGCYNFAADC